MIKILQENQSKVVEYLNKHYDNVSVMLVDNWMRLDFNQDGHVSMEDLRKAAQELYEFMINFDYIEKATEIKSNLYHQAIKFMKKEANADDVD
jgi:hypothetical protein